MEQVPYLEPTNIGRIRTYGGARDLFTPELGCSALYYPSRLHIPDLLRGLSTKVYDISIGSDIMSGALAFSKLHYARVELT